MGLFDRLLGPNINKLESNGDIDALAQLVTSDDHRNLRTAAIEALARIGKPQVTRTLVGALFNDAPDAKRAAETAVTGLGSAAGPELVETLGRPGDEVALSLLLHLGEEGVEFLRTACTHQNEATRKRALSGLIQLDTTLGSPEVREVLFRALLAALGDRSADCRVIAAETLQNIGDERASRALASQLKDGDENVRKACRDALQSIGEPTVPYLLDALADRNANSKRLAAELLEAVCCHEVEAESRRVALFALADHVSDSNTDHAAAVRQALQAIPGDTVISEQLEWLADPERSDHEDTEDFLTVMLKYGGLSATVKDLVTRRIAASE